jgi:hypothetical protein
MAEAMEHRGYGGNRNAPPGGPHEGIEEFIRLKAPTIGYSNKPLDADDWPRIIETKLDLTVYTGEEWTPSPRTSWMVLLSLGGTITPPATRTQFSSLG